jgi:hypothetical protein
MALYFNNLLMNELPWRGAVLFIGVMRAFMMKSLQRALQAGLVEP